jgi:hypothetical protein
MVCDLLQKIVLFQAVGTQFTPADAKEVVKSLYDILTILDTKGLALLAFDGIVVAATAFTAEKGEVFTKHGVARWLAIAIIIMALTASALCLGVSRVSYDFFGYVDCAPGKLDFTNEIDELTILVGRRTWYYQSAWWLSLAAIPLFLTMFSMSLEWRSGNKKRRRKS